MKVKVYIFNNVTAVVSDDFPKVTDYFSSPFVRQFINEEIIFNIEKTDVPRQNVPAKLFYPNDGKYDVVMYLYEKGTWNDGWFGLTFNVSKTLRGVYLNTDILDDNVDFTWKSIAHELVHCLCYKIESDKNVVIANLLDAPIVNGVVNPFYGNEDPYLVNGNFQQALQLLAPYYKPNSAPTAILTRNVDDGTEILGTLQVGALFQCQSLELPWRMNQKNISAIPKGTYTCSWKFMARELSYHYQVMNVPNRTGIFLHNGSTFFDTEGCILLGSLPVGTKKLINTRTILANLEKLMNYQQFTLEIK